MIEKKTKKADLERKKSTYLQIGLIVAVSFTLVAFEWSTPKWILPEFVSGLEEELNPEVVHAAELSKPQKPNQPAQKQSVTNPTVVIVTEEPPVVNNVEPIEVFKIDPSEFVEDTKDSVIIEKVKPTETVNAGLFEGTLPHYKECIGLTDKEMFECISDQINIKISPNTRNIHSLNYTGPKRIKATFTVDEKGNVSEIYVHKEKSFEKDIVKEVKRAIFALPQMIPGSQGDDPVKVRFTLPMSFSVQ